MKPNYIIKNINKESCLFDHYLREYDDNNIIWAKDITNAIVFPKRKAEDTIACLHRHYNNKEIKLIEI